ncbi:MAG: pyruvate:ferredoxin (flavodoxin) oxidoreductase [Anaerovoracaceae bacterium]
MKITVDGNHAAAYAAYAFTEVAVIYPITPSTPMAELMDEWSSLGKENIFGQQVKVVELQSEAGVAGAMHGSLGAGALTTTFTASQGLLLMIPNLYKMAGELLPGVFHVSARSIATHALSIFGDHQDVMACRQTGAPMIASVNPQEVMDLGFISHLSAISAHLPFIHFFDGFRTSHEYRNIELLEYDSLHDLIDWKAIEEFRNRGLHPSHPVVKGTAQNPDIYFQGREVQNKFYDRVPDIVAEYMKRYGEKTGRYYRPFDYYGDNEAESLIIAMGSVCDTIKETINYLAEKGEKVGLVQVRLYRPFSEKYFFEVLPPGIKRIAVLDRTKEPGSTGEPLLLDICKMFSGKKNQPMIIGGRYGLGSKDVTPWQILAVIANLNDSEPKTNFTIGIQDDVTETSLDDSICYTPVENNVFNCQFWGLGSDGTVSANKLACKIIGENTELNVQAYFSYDSKKSGGTTVSHLRFGKDPILSPYLIYAADYVACHNKSFLNNFDITRSLKKEGVFLLNCNYSPKTMEKHLPEGLKRFIAKEDIQFYIIDAEKIASEIGLGNRISMIMQAAFFKLIDIIPEDKAMDLLKDSIQEAFGYKSRKLVEMNFQAIDEGVNALVKVHVPSHWADIGDWKNPDDEGTGFVERIQKVMARNEGDTLPVSAFIGMEDGAFPPGITAFEKRGIAPSLPQWQVDRCVQCGRCSYVCPHATIRLFLLDEGERERAPKSYTTKPAVGKGLESYGMRVQISPMDCTGCGNCADICPAKGKALIMKPVDQEIRNETQNWEFSMTLKEKPDIISRFTVKGSQFVRPLLEFNGACPGCGETPYIKLLTQLFGERMMIANATGCSSIWGASAPSIAYTTNEKGRGPAWANSLFEDNAEYGYGMHLAIGQMRERLKAYINYAMTDSFLDEGLKKAFVRWMDVFNEGHDSLLASEEIKRRMEGIDLSNNSILRQIRNLSDYLEKRSIWMIGGDGWAYDIGYGGLDHVLSTGDDVNIFVMDTEVYSNTGGQASKATPAGAVAKFAFKGKETRKKDLGLMAITYGKVYVAQIAMGADMNQTIKAMCEAESYRGPSLIIAYSPCISHGIKSGMSTSMREEKKAVDSGYWHLYRYDPRLYRSGKNPFQLDSKEPILDYEDFIEGEIRYSQLSKRLPQQAKRLFRKSKRHAMGRLDNYKHLLKRF